MTATPRDERILSFFASLIQDTAYVLRKLLKSPGFAIVVIGSLALGIGASVAVFSVIRAVLLDPYPYKDADRMVHVELTQKDSAQQNLLSVTATEYPDLLRLPSVDDVFLMDNRMQALHGNTMPVSVVAGFYSPNLFTYLGVPPLLGREFTQADVAGGNANPVAVLSYLFWKKRYGGRLDILGKTIQLDQATYTVIGVASPRFTWGDSDVYIPATFKADPHYYLTPFLKLKRGAAFAAVAAELQPLVNSYAKLDPNNYPQNAKVAIKTLNEEVMKGFKSPLLTLFAAVLLLLLIGCANVSILMLARATNRQHEFAVRASVGATRARIIRQLLTEAVILSLVGAGAGVSIAYKCVDLLAATLPQNSFPHEAAIHVSGTVLLFAIGTALLTGLLFGSSPAWQFSRPDVSALMQSSSTKLAGNVRGRNFHRMLIAGQVIFTMVMLAGSGAAVRAFLTLYHTPMGFDPDHLFYINTGEPREASPNWQHFQVMQESIRQAAESTPGVISASISDNWVPPFQGYFTKISFSGNPTLTNPQASLALISFNMFSTLRIPLLSGRFYTQAETARGAHVALVNRAFVKQFARGGDVIGRSVRSPGLKLDIPDAASVANPDGWLQIIGVVDDARNNGLDMPVQPAVYLPDTFILGPHASLVIRARSDTKGTMRDVEAKLHRLNSQLVIEEEHDFKWLLETQAWGRERFLASLFGLFASLALTLSAAGIYSVVSYTVSQRTRELGVRMALGAQRIGVVRLVLESSLETVSLGAIAGLILSFLAGKFLATSPHANVRDPAMLLAAAGVLLLVSAIACLYPVWRAASINPMEAIRTD
ncbi:MAG TPA: ABC transporter permease [Terracidiphilus sp.]